MTKNSVAILGINGHIGGFAAQAFVDAGWSVRGMGRSIKHPIPGVEFVEGDAERIADIRRAIGDCTVVVNALNLPYDKWFGGALEAQTERVIEAIGPTGKTLIYPGNIYNYAASLREVTPQAPQHPERPRGEIRVRCERMLEQAANRGGLQVIVLRAGDFFGPGKNGDWFEQGILARKGKIASPSPPEIAHSWAYLPDLARAFEKLARRRADLGAFENFHFAGHFVTAREMVRAVQNAAPVPLKVVSFPWALISVIGLFNPMMREVNKMRYLWLNPMQLTDARLSTILGANFNTPYEKAVAEAVRPFFS